MFHAESSTPKGFGAVHRQALNIEFASGRIRRGGRSMKEAPTRQSANVSLMKTLALFILFLSAVAPSASAEPFVIIVRHAEKAAEGGNDPELSPAGVARAEALSQMLKDSKLVAIFTSEFKRTQETAAPTAELLGIMPTVIGGKDASTLATKLKSLDGNALVVGHGNTIPDLVKALGMQESIEITESDYTQIFIVTLGEKPKLLRLHYPQ